MVLEIRLSNFFSIKDEITLDLRAGNIQSKQTKELCENIFDYNKTNVLKTLAIYGANASGKSNIVKAIRFCNLMILLSHNHNENSIFSFMPFKLDDYQNKPSSYFIRFVSNTIEYEYSFTLTKDKILTEALYFYPKGRVTKIFERNEKAGDTKSAKYSFGNYIKRPMDVAENTSNKTLFISRASQMDREIPKEIFKFFDTQFILNILPMNDAKIEYYFKNYKTELLEALKIADSDIVDLSIKKEIVPVTRLDFAKGENLHLKTNISNQMEEMVIIGCFHRNAPNVVFDFLTEESSGTIKMFFALLTILDIVKENKILLIDELEEKLHTHIVEFIIKLFNKSEKAQLIYTTHNTNLLDLKKVRKDQIIFCNKKEDASTEVYSLYDFKDFREGMDLEKAYLQGRFDAIPFINDSEENIKQLIYE